MERGDRHGKKRTSVFDIQLDLPEETLWQTVTSCRWVLSYVAFVAFIFVYALRINMGIAIVCMVKAVNASATESSGNNECQATNNTTAIDFEASGGDIEWNKFTQGWVLSSFFYGYILTQIPGGWLAGRYGGKRVMLIGLLIFGAATVVLPFAASPFKKEGSDKLFRACYACLAHNNRFGGSNATVSATLVIILRVIAGISTGVMFPAIHNILGRWAPPFERSKLTVFSLSGTLVGNVLMLGLGGFFCEWEAFDGGWPSMFYVGGGLCLLFCVVWALTIYDSPAEHPRISDRERLYIEMSMEGVQEGKNDYVPWKDIMSSPAMWAIIVAHFCNNFGNYTLMTKLPAFMKEVLQFDIKSNGLFSMLPYIASFLVANTVSQCIDKLRENGSLTTTCSRKIAMIMAMVIPAGLLVATGHIPCGMNYLGVIFLTTAVAFTGFNRSGYNVNPQDIANRYAGEIMGISNTVATIPGMIAPSLVNAMTPNGSKEEWQIVFYVWAGIYCFGAIIFTLFARGKTQDWNWRRQYSHNGSMVRKSSG